MAVELATAYISIVPSFRGAPGAIRSGLSGPLAAAGDQAGATAGKRYAHRFAIAAKVGLAGVAVGIAAVFKTGFDEAKDASAGTAQLTAGIKSTGNAAHVTVKGLNDLASSIQGYSGQTDDSIVAAEKLLLTFTNIKNTGPDKIFDQATAAAADMAARMGGDASSNAIRLGKALNDPVKGITALTKVGVSFTDQQKKQVTQMVKTGNTVGAQKIILGELTKEFGGSAKAAGQSIPGQMARAKRAFEDVSQEVVTGLLPVLTKVLTFFQGTLLPGIKSFVGWVQAHWPAVKDVIVSTWEQYIHPVLAAIGTFITTKVIPAVEAVVAFVVAHWPQIKNAFVTAWAVIQPTLAAFGDLLKTIWTSVLQPIVAWVQAHWPQISAVIKVAFVAIAVAAAVVVTALKVAFRIIAAEIRVVAAVFGWLWHNIVAPVFNGIVAVIRGASAAIGPIIGGIGSAVHKIGGFFSDVYATVKRVVGEIIAVVRGIGGKIAAIAHGIWSPLGAGLSAVVGTIKALIQPIIDAIQRVVDAAQHAKDFLTGGSGKNLTDPILKNLMAAPSGGLSGPHTPRRALGGPVTAGHPYVVNERGIETFIPNVSGRIEPAGSSPFGSGPMSISGRLIIDDQGRGELVDAFLNVGTQLTYS